MSTRPREEYSRPTRALGPGAAEPAGEYWDGVVDEWEPSPLHRLWRAHSDAVNTRLLSRWVSPGRGRLLKTDLFDEAVGVGLYPELARRFDEVVAIDLSPRTVRIASDRYPALDARVGSVLAMPFPDSSFDLVVSNSTLDHFASHAQLRAAVAELARVVRPGGKLVITLDNRANPVIALRTSKLFGVLHRLGVVPYFVGATCGPLRLKRMLREAGFEVTETASIMHCPPQLAAWASTRRAEPRHSEPPAQCEYIRRVLRFEALGNWPTRYLTGHFVAALAIRL